MKEITTKPGKSILKLKIFGRNYSLGINERS